MKTFGIAAYQAELAGRSPVRGKASHLFRLVLVGATLQVLFCLPANATTYTWDGSEGPAWTNSQNWTPAGEPGDGADVFIADAGADPVLSADTASLSSLIITNKTLIFTNWSTRLFATNVVIRNAGVLTLPGAFTAAQMSNRVHVVCKDFTLDAGAGISVDARGFAADAGPGAGALVSGDASGGGHGGHGGAGKKGVAPIGGGANGVPEAPSTPGSGGGGDGEGGGVVRIDASGAVTVNGIIAADGEAPGNYGGGAGGSI